MIIHEIYPTRERGHKISPHIYNTPLCGSCNLSIESQEHKFCLCPTVYEAWAQLRELFENLDFYMVFESNHSLLNLYFSEPLSGPTILWLLGEYVDLVANNHERGCKVLSKYYLLRHLRFIWLECTRAMKLDIVFIPGLFTEGVG